MYMFFFFFKQKTAYEMRISDWSSDVCSSDLGVYRILIPRTDLDVTVGEVAIRPSFALGSYAAFLGTPDDATVVGDLVLLEDEVNPVLTRLQDAGMQQTALHRHLLDEDPKAMYMNYTGHGNATHPPQGTP